MNHLIEIRALNLKPDTREEFHRLYIEEALALLQRWNFDVLAHGPSWHDENTYYVIRHFDSLAQREQTEDACYGSDEWRTGPREATNFDETVFVCRAEDFALNAIIVVQCRLSIINCSSS